MAENETDVVHETETLAQPQQGAERRRYWQEHIERWRRSGMTQKDYCEKNGVKRSAFYYWKKRLEEPSSGSVNLVQVPLEPHRPSKGLVLQLGDHYRVQIGDEFSPATLTRLVQTLVPLSWS